MPSSRYAPPTPTFSSSQGTHAANVASSDVKFTATFDSAVTGVAVGDFGLTSSNADVVYTTSVSGTGKVWVLTASVTDGYANTDFAVTMPSDSGAISKPNAAGANNGFKLQCTCHDDTHHWCQHLLTTSSLQRPQTALRSPR